MGMNEFMSHFIHQLMATFIFQYDFRCISWHNNNNNNLY